MRFGFESGQKRLPSRRLAPIALGDATTRILNTVLIC